MDRYNAAIRQFLKFGMVGGSGMVVNLVVTVLAKKIAWWSAGITEHDAALNLLGSQYNIRWFNVIAVIAFLISNTWNFQINRMWTFNNTVRRNWFKEFFAFLLTGIGAFIVGQIVLTSLMNPNSWFALPSSIFDDSSGFRTKFYWATVASIVAAMPVNFLINKKWTFSGHKVVAEKDPE